MLVQELVCNRDNACQFVPVILSTGLYMRKKMMNQKVSAPIIFAGSADAVPIFDSAVFQTFGYLLAALF